jgi:hypothetical protein
VIPEYPKHPKRSQLANSNVEMLLLDDGSEKCASKLSNTDVRDRVLAILLSTISLLVHIGVFAILETALASTWTGSWCALYDVCAVFASLAGVIGAVDVRVFPSPSVLKQFVVQSWIGFC